MNVYVYFCDEVGEKWFLEMKKDEFEKEFKKSNFLLVKINGNEEIVIIDEYRNVRKEKISDKILAIAIGFVMLVYDSEVNRYSINVRGVKKIKRYCEIIKEYIKNGRVLELGSEMYYNDLNFELLLFNEINYFGMKYYIEIGGKMLVWKSSNVVFSKEACEMFKSRVNEYDLLDRIEKFEKYYEMFMKWYREKRKNKFMYFNDDVLPIGDNEIKNCLKVRIIEDVYDKAKGIQFKKGDIVYMPLYFEVISSIDDSNVYEVEKKKYAERLLNMLEKVKNSIINGKEFEVESLDDVFRNIIEECFVQFFVKGERIMIWIDTFTMDTLRRVCGYEFIGKEEEIYDYVVKKLNEYDYLGNIDKMIYELGRIIILKSV